jgi:HK97 family phage portal protein
MNQTSLVGRPLHALTRSLVGFAEKRGLWTYGQSSDASLARSGFWGSTATTSTGVMVSEMTALTYSVVWACVNNISTDVGSLPLILYKKRPDGGKDRLTDHKLSRILHDEPNPEMSSMTFRGTIQAHALTWGNGYAEIQRNGAGAVEALWPITPDRVAVKRDGNGTLYYQVDGSARVPAANMLHISGLGYDGIVGYNLIHQAREAIAMGLATERFGGTFFGGGATFGGVISLKTDLTLQARESFREAMLKQHQGVEKAHGFLLLGNEATYTPLGVQPNNAQFLETRQNQVEEICRFFRMPPHKVQHLLRSTNNNIEHQGIEYYSDTLRAWCVRWEQEIKRKLIAPSERTIQFAEHKIEGVLRGDLQSRYAAYAIGISNGWLSADDVRYLENMNPLESGQGKFYYAQMNMLPANRLMEWVDKQVAPEQKALPPAAPPTSARGDEAVEAIRTAMEDVEKRIAATTMKIANTESMNVVLQETNGTLTADVAELRGQLATEQAERATLQSLLLHATERADHLALEQDAAHMAEATARSERDAAQAEVAQLKLLRDEAQTRADALQAERDTAQASYADAKATAEQASAAHSQALIDVQTGAESERTVLTERMEELHTRLMQAESVRDERAVELDKRSDALALAQAASVALGREVQALAATVTAAEAKVDAAIAETMQVRTSADEALATQAEQLAAEQQAKAELEKQLADVRAYAATVEASLAAEKAHAEAAKAVAADAIDQAAAVRMEADAAEREKVTVGERLAGEQTARALAEAAMSALKRSVIDHRQKQTTEHRAVMAVAVAKFVRVERDRAMRNCGSPAKLKAWAESFYLLHVDSVVEGLLPLMRAHLAFIESDADAEIYTRAIVEPHLRAAKAQILAIADGDPEEFQVSLERLMTRWEHDRPAAIADAILQEEVTYVRSL